MTKVFKIIGRTTGIILEWLLIAFFILALVIRTSTFQTYLASAATAYLSSELNAKIQIDKVDILFFDRAALDHVYVEDQQKDTLALINSLVVNIDLLDITNQLFTLDKVKLDGGNIHINRSKDTGKYNYAFLVDYFSSESKSEPKPFNFNINRIEISDIRFNYDDNRKPKNANGIDWNHISVSALSLKATDFKINLTDFQANILDLKLKEKSGFTVNQLSTSLKIGNKGLFLTNLDICTNESDISASKFNLLYTKQSDFEDFENKVRFDATILQSSIALHEITFFTSETQGMSDFVRLEGNVTNCINQLALTNFKLGFGKVSTLEGDFVLPNFSKMNDLKLNQTIRYAYISVEDLTSFKLPKSSGISKLNLGKEVERLGFFESRNLTVQGSPSDLSILFETTKTKLGEVKLNAPFHIISNQGSIGLNSETQIGDDIEFINFQLGELLADNSLKTIDGKVSMQSTYYDNGNFEIEHVTGKVNQIDYQDYSIHNATITNGSLINQVFQSDITLDDDILKLTYTGYIDLKGDKKLKFNVNLTEALLNSLNLARSSKASSLKSRIEVDLHGLNPSTMSGTVKFKGFVYKEGKDEIDIPEIDLSIIRGKLEDKFKITSDEFLELEVIGKFDLKSIVDEFTNQISNAFPFLSKSFPKKKVSKNNHFTYDLRIWNTGNFLGKFFPGVKNFSISYGTTVNGSYSAKDENFELKVFSENGLTFDNIKIGKIELNQTINKEKLDVKLDLFDVNYGNKVKFKDINFKTENEGVRRDLLTSSVNWRTTDNINSNLSWLTTIKDASNFEINLNESAFSINSQLWKISESSYISYSPELISIENFLLSNEDQKIELDGNLSSLTNDFLDFKLENINLAEIDQLLGLRQGLSGMLNGSGRLSDPINNLSLKSTLDIKQLQLKTQAVGDIRVNVDWDPKLDYLDLSGIIKNKGKTNFEYDGKYYFKRSKENLDFNLKFKEFDISFANAYVDKDVISNIKGDISGLVKITGTPNKPKFHSRELFLKRAKAKVEILGTTMSLSGKFNLMDNDVYGDKIELVDEENNRAYLNFGLYNFLGKWNYDIGIDILERLNQSKRFLVLNTKYKDGDYYYGKVYGTGSCNISGNSDQLDIVVDIKTSKGSKLTLPLYGVSEVEEGDDFITFTKSNSVNDSIKKIDLTGVTLDLNFDVTPETELSVVFNDQTQDKIVSYGSGKIAMKIDDKDNDIKMTGKYNIEKGSTYNFAMGQIKKEFNIDQGSYIEWSDNIYDAIINITTSFKTKSDYGALAPELEETTLANQVVNCELLLNGQLTKPEISFNLKAEQNLPETGKALLNRVLDEQSEINRQFFSLLVFNRFQPLKGNISASGSAALDLAEAQINDLLSKASEEFKMKMNIDSDIELIAEKRFFEDRLIITTSVGVETGANNSETSTTSSAKNTIIGDVRIEYLINEKGTFRVNAFNESNRNTVNQSAGLFSQGAGLNYQEEFNGWNDFQLIQSFLDIFRAKRNKKVKTKRNKRQIKVSDASENKDEPIEKIPLDKQIKGDIKF